MLILHGDAGLASTMAFACHGRGLPTAELADSIDAVRELKSMEKFPFNSSSNILSVRANRRKDFSRGRGDRNVCSLAKSDMVCTANITKNERLTWLERSLTVSMLEGMWKDSNK